MKTSVVVLLLGNYYFSHSKSHESLGTSLLGRSLESFTIYCPLW